MAQHCFYRVIEHCEESQYKCTFSREINVMRQLDAEDAAELCANDYYANHDGWDGSWPLTFAIYETQHGEECCRVKVERELVAEYSGTMLPSE